MEILALRCAHRLKGKEAEDLLVCYVPVMLI